MELNKTYSNKQIKDLIDWIDEIAVETHIPGRKKREAHVTVKDDKWEINVNAKRLKKALSMLRRQKAVSVTFNIQKVDTEAKEFVKSLWLVETIKYSFVGLAINYIMPSGTHGTLVIA